MTASDRLSAALGALWLVALAASLAVTGDRLTWFLEVVPVLVAIPLIAATRQRFPLTTLLTVLVFAHGLVLILGGTYTYAKVPLGFWVQDALDLARNP